MKKLDVDKLSAAIQYIDSWLEFNFDDSRITGMQVAIRHEGELQYSKAFGQADVAKAKPLTTDHVFRIASQSKTFTATAIMQLKEDKKLDLDDTVQQYLPWFQSKADKRVRQQVTIRQLLNHTAGIIRDGLDADFWQLGGSFPDGNELKGYIANSSLIYDPDEVFKYSNFGFGYLGLLIEAVSGQPYNDYMTEHILKPLKLESTGPELDAKTQRLLPTPYGLTLMNQPRQALRHIDTHALSPATGFYANAEDLTAYFAAQCLGNGKLLNDTSKRLMQHGYWDIEQDTEKYGLGMVNYPQQDWKLYGHSGGFPGFLTNTKFDPEKRFVSSVLANCLGVQTSAINDCIVSIIDKFQQADRPDPKLAKYAGRFETLWGVIDVVPIGSQLYGISPMHWSHFQATDELVQVAKNTFKITKARGYDSPGESVIYDFGSNGTIKSLRYAGATMKPWRTNSK